MTSTALVEVFVELREERIAGTFCLALLATSRRQLGSREGNAIYWGRLELERRSADPSTKLATNTLAVGQAPPSRLASREAGDRFGTSISPAVWKASCELYQG